MLFMALALSNQQERALADCYEEAAGNIEARERSLNTSWESAKPVTPSLYWGLEYRTALNRAATDNFQFRDCFSVVNAEVEKRSRNSPREIINSLRKDAKGTAKAIAMYGVELPDKASADLFGTPIRIEIATATHILQIALGPILFLWLNSLYSTRYRETLLIAEAKAAVDIFPHAINIYPTFILKPPRKKNWVMLYAPHLIAAFYSVTRVGLVSIFAIPPTVAYIWSLWALNSSSLDVLFVVLGVLVGSASFAVLVNEIQPWHVLKGFKGRAPRRAEY